MQIEERVTILEDEFTELKEDLQHIMLDIRAFLMEANSPLRSDLNIDELPPITS